MVKYSFKRESTKGVDLDIDNKRKVVDAITQEIVRQGYIFNADISSKVKQMITRVENQGNKNIEIEESLFNDRLLLAFEEIIKLNDGVIPDGILDKYNELMSH